MRERTGCGFFEGCEGNAAGKPRVALTEQARATGCGRREREVETSEVIPVPGATAWKPVRGVSRRGGDRTTRAEHDGSGGTDLPKGGQLPGSGRAPEKSVGHPANELSASETRRHDTEEARQQQVRVPRGARVDPGGNPRGDRRTNRRARSNARGPLADPHGVTGQPVTTGPGSATEAHLRTRLESCGLSGEQSLRRCRFSHLHGGRGPRSGGRAQARPDCGRGGRDGVVPPTTGM